MAPEYTEQLFGVSPKRKATSAFTTKSGHISSGTSSPRCGSGGLVSVQPGIESFSTHVLKLMKKHSTGMRNLELMKWCTYYDINNLYNILVGFAGETSGRLSPAMRRDRQDRSPASRPTPSPGPAPTAVRRCSRIRTSMASARCGPADCYRYLFPRGRFDLNKISYYFDHDGPGMLPDQEYDDIFHAVGAWQERWRAAAAADVAISQVMRVDLHRGRPDPDDAQVRIFRRRAALYEFCMDAKNRSGDRSTVRRAGLAGGALERNSAKRDLMIRAGRAISQPCLAEKCLRLMYALPQTASRQIPMEAWSDILARLPASISRRRATNFSR